jgi:mutator protein MutT
MVKNMLVVAAAIILNEGKVLIAQREEGSNMEFKWEFPGGKLEGYENPEQALIREIKEELDMIIEPVEIYKAVRHKYKDKDILLLAYICRFISGEGRPLECNDFKWVDKKQLSKFEYTLADVEIVEKLKNDQRYLN